MTDLAFLTATQALALFRNKSLSPVEMTDAIIKKAAVTEPEINALPMTYFDDARKAAREAEARYMGKGATPRPLEGICVAVKDSGTIAGQVTSAGSLLSRSNPQTETSPINKRVLESGAIVHARSATPEFSTSLVTWSRRWGVTRNPWNLEMAPGGSSGGAGATLAAGSSTLATGSDIGGSIRVPASCCGVVGYKPPRGRNPVDPPFNLDAFCHTGPLARCVSDILLFQNVLSGPLAQDSTLLPKRLITPRSRDVKDLKIALSSDLGCYQVDDQITSALKRAADGLRCLGAKVEEVAIPWTEEVQESILTHLRMIFGTSIAPDATSDWEKMTPYARSFAEAGLTVTPRDYLEALNIAAEAGRTFGDATCDFDVIICPTTALPSVPATFDYSIDLLNIGGQDVEPMLGWGMAAPFNMLSTRPVLSVPIGRASNSVPIGMQIVGHAFDEDTVFQTAFALEGAGFDWFGFDRLTPPSQPPENQLVL